MENQTKLEIMLERIAVALEKIATQGARAPEQPTTSKEYAQPAPADFAEYTVQIMREARVWASGKGAFYSCKLEGRFATLAVRGSEAGTRFAIGDTATVRARKELKQVERNGKTYNDATLWIDHDGILNVSSGDALASTTREQPAPIENALGEDVPF